MVESAEGIGGRTWSLERWPSFDIHGAHDAANPADEPMALTEGTTLLAILTKAGERDKALLAVAPQLWDAANEFLKQWILEQDPSRLLAARWRTPTDEAALRLGNMVAKAVGKTDWKDVAQ